MGDVTRTEERGAGSRAPRASGWRRSAATWAVPFGLWAVALIAAHAAGVRMVVRWGYWQLLDPAALADHPWTSLTLLHSQPPLLNALAAVLLQLSDLLGVSFELAAGVVFDAVGLLATLVMYDLGRRLTGSRALAVVGVVALLADPGFHFLGHLFFYPFLLQALLLIMLWAATRWLQSGGQRDLRIVVISLGLLCLARSLYHPAWALGTFALLVAARRWHVRNETPPKLRGTIGPALALVALLALWPLKNLVVFGEPVLSSWMGYYVSLGIPIRDAELNDYIGSGVIPNHTADRLQEFAERYGDARIDVLGAPEKSEGSRNWNHLVLLETNAPLHRRALDWRLANLDAWARQAGVRYVGTARGTWLHPYLGTPFGPASDGWKAWSDAYKAMFFVDLRPLLERLVAAPELHAQVNMRGQPLPYTLYGFVLLPAVLFAALLIMARRRSRHRVEEVVVVLALLAVCWVLLASSLLTQEGNRVRFATSPFVILLALYIAREVGAKLRARRAATAGAVALMVGLTTVGCAEPQSGSATGAASMAVAVETAHAVGTVFHDRDGDGQLDPDEPGLAGVRVSNGRDVVATDSNGRYMLVVEGDTEIFVIKPRGWMVPTDENHLPRYFYVHRPDGSPNSRDAGLAPTGPLPPAINFPLTPQDEPDVFRALLFGDTQVRTEQELAWLDADIVQDLVGFEGAFGVTLGDLVFDRLHLFDELNSTLARIGLPWFSVIGNHDLNTDARVDELANETFIRVYGPADYAFDWGPVHFVVLDDVFWTWNEDKHRGGYRGRVTERTLAFVENDLSHVPRETLTVFLMHIPLTSLDNGSELMALFDDRPWTLSVSAHTHTTRQEWLDTDDGWLGDRPHHHVVNVTTCGSWWRGERDATGIPHTTMRDGAPNGYTIVSFDGTDYRLDFRAAREPADHQMNIHVPDDAVFGRTERTRVHVNVFAGSDRTRVVLRLDGGSWRSLEQVFEPDPSYAALVARERDLDPAPRPALPNPIDCPHLWAGPLPADLAAGEHLVEVRATDPWGRSVTATRTLLVGKDED